MHMSEEGDILTSPGLGLKPKLWMQEEAVLCATPNNCYLIVHM